MVGIRDSEALGGVQLGGAEHAPLVLLDGCKIMGCYSECFQSNHWHCMHKPKRASATPRIAHYNDVSVQTIACVAYQESFAFLDKSAKM